MGIDRWKQEHRNWRPNGARFVASEAQPEASPSLVPSEKPVAEKTAGAKPRAAKKAAAPSENTKRSPEKVLAKRGKR